MMCIGIEKPGSKMPKTLMIRDVCFPRTIQR